MPGARKKRKTSEIDVASYRHTDSRKNIPPAKIAAEGRVPAVPTVSYSFNPRLDPRLRFDDSADADKLQEMVETACQRKLSEEEAREAREVLGTLRLQEPWLEWAGKREAQAPEIDPVALHIHERVSANAILKVAARKDVTRDLFADPEHEYLEAVQFYQHDVDWANRLILGDSLQVMASLAERENLSGQVQMIYFDPPYGISFGSNFQVNVGDRDQREDVRHLTREPEMIRAYRDTWTLGIHSYLTYLRDRLVVARDLLKDDGSIFVQIGEENLPNVSLVLDEVFGRLNRIQIITVKKKSSTQKGQSVADYLLWYAKDKSNVKMPDVYVDPGLPEDSQMYRHVEFPSGERRPADALSKEEKKKLSHMFVRDGYPVVSQHFSETRSVDIVVEGRKVSCGAGKQWRYDVETGMKRLERAGRLRAGRGSAYGVAYWGDGRLAAIPNVWTEFHGEASPVYVVQTNRKIVERCMLMSTEPGDLVLDPTCGSGTTAYVAEQWGRRWITIDTSRVAVCIARQRMMTAAYDFYKFKDPEKGLRSGFQCDTVGHITLRSIASNENLDPIFERHEEILDQKLEECNSELRRISDSLRAKLAAKVSEKAKTTGRKSVTSADKRRWILPANDEGFEHWTVPFDTDPDWPESLSDAVTAYRKVWRTKMDEVNECISLNAPQTELPDKPIVARGVLRVSGPFSVEAVQPAEVSLETIGESPIGGAPEAMPDSFTEFGSERGELGSSAVNAQAYLDQMIHLMKLDGVRFPDNRQMKFGHLEAAEGGQSAIHAEGTWMPGNVGGGGGGGHSGRRIERLRCHWSTVWFRVGNAGRAFCASSEQAGIRRTRCCGIQL